MIKIDGKFTPPISKDTCKFILENSRGNPSLLSEEDFSSAIKAMLENQKRIIERKYKKNYLFIKYKFSEITGEPLLFYKNISTNQHYIKNAKEIFSDISLINHFDSKDRACIGNIVGCFEIEKELSSLHPEWTKQPLNNEVMKKIKL